jgi:hypothetical protein
MIDEREQAPPKLSLLSAHAHKRRQAVALPIAREEHELRARAKQMGTRWSQEQKGGLFVSVGRRTRLQRARCSKRYAYVNIGVVI